MPPVDRAQFLSAQWQPYPSFRRNSVVTILELSDFARACVPRVELAGKLLAVEASTGWVVMGAQNCVWRLQLAGPWPLETREGMPIDGRPILTAGDSISLQLAGCDWSQSNVRTLSAQVERARLLSPAREEFGLASEYWSQAPLWSRFVNGVRGYFTSRGCQEVWTPTLVKCPGLEPTLDPLAVQVTMSEGRVAQFYLPTSPELHLKKLLAQGGGDLFEIKECFRDGEMTDHHQPEFWMLEWYRAFADLSLIAEDLGGLLTSLHQQGLLAQSPGALSRKTMAEVFAECFDFRLTPNTTRHELEQLCASCGLPTQPGDSWDDLFHLLFIAKVEPRLPEWGPVLITHFPPSQRALARLTEDGWADRFEFYWQGLEIANAFNELNDPEEQLARCHADNEERRRLGKAALPLDEEFIRALRSGMPPAAGIALGLERLLMAGLGLTEIRQLRAFFLSPTAAVAASDLNFSR